MKPHWDRGSQNHAELEALQTDVMRFIAIIGLCLAAIFSLVNGAQQMPVPEPVEANLPPPQPVPLAGQSKQLPEPGRQVEAGTGSARDPGAAPEPIPNIDPKPQLARRQSENVAVVEPAEEPASTDPGSPKPRRLVEENPGSESAPPSPPENQQQQAGFTLEFESMAALGKLLEARRIQVYATVDNEFWVYRHGEGLRTATAPDSYYQMDSATVPPQLQGLADGLFPDATVQWGVSLPHSTVAEIQRRMREYDYGQLLITADAGVRVSTP